MGGLQRGTGMGAGIMIGTAVWGLVNFWAGIREAGPNRKQEGKFWAKGESQSGEANGRIEGVVWAVLFCKTFRTFKVLAWADMVAQAIASKFVFLCEVDTIKGISYTAYGYLVHTKCLFV